MIKHKNLRLRAVLSLLVCAVYFPCFALPISLYRSLGAELSQDSLSLPTVSAHRGGRFIPGYPENALETFDYTHQKTPQAWIECDISLSSDSVLFLLHDNTLARTTTGSGSAAMTPWHGTIDTCHLKDDFGNITTFKIPLLDEALRWAKRKGVVLTLDVKRGVPFERVIEAVRAHQLVDQLVVITYNVSDALTVHQLEPNIMISVTIRNEEELRRHLDAGIPPAKMIAFTGTSLADADHFARLRSLGIPCIIGVLGNLDQSASVRGDKVYHQCLENGAQILATDRPGEAWRAITTYPLR